MCLADGIPGHLMPISKTCQVFLTHLNRTQMRIADSQRGNYTPGRFCARISARKSALPILADFDRSFQQPGW